MRNAWVRIILWLGIMAVLTVAAVVLWYIVSGGSQTTASLKWLQLVQTMATFLLPPVLCAWIWDTNHRPMAWLKLHKTTHWKFYLLAIAIMVCAIPGINLLADLNSRIELPESLDSIEQFLKQQEEAAAVLTERFLKADDIGILLLNIGLMALLPALSEELSFRGTLQQIITNGEGNKAKVHVAIWVTAFIFSAIHMQFYGFIPRMLMGALFGYMFVWSGSLWIPVVMHFTNNGIAVLAYYFIGEDMVGKNYADTIGAGTTWWLGVISLLTVGVLLWITFRDLREYDRRTHIQ